MGQTWEGNDDPAKKWKKVITVIVLSLFSLAMGITALVLQSHDEGNNINMGITSNSFLHRK
jgi:hypothetical protein